MTATNNLGLTHVAAAQNQKEVTMNAALDGVDQALGTVYFRDLAGVSVGVTLPASAVLNAALEFTGSAITAIATIVFPTASRQYTIRNSAVQDLQLQTSARTNASGCMITSGTFVIVQHNGTLLRAVTSVANTSSPYDVGGFIAGGISTASAELVNFVFTRQVQFEPNFVGSKARLRTSTTATTTYDIQKDGVSVGTFYFVPGPIAANAFFSATATTVFGPSSVLTIVSPASPDATAGGLYFTLAGKRL